MVVGSPYDDDKGADSGAIYVFVKDNNDLWVEKQKIVASDGAINDNFGNNFVVSGDGTVIVVGCYNKDVYATNSGMVYVFIKDTNGVYIQKQTIVQPYATNLNMNFGKVIDITSDGNTIVIGHPFYFAGSIYNSGQVYVYKKNVNNNFSLAQTLQSIVANNVRFGMAAAITGDGGIIFASDVFQNFGEVRVFNLNNNSSYINTNSALRSNPLTTNGGFGTYIKFSMDGKTAIIYSSSIDKSIYVFKFNIITSLYEQSFKLNTIFNYSIIDLSSNGDIICSGAPTTVAIENVGKNNSGVFSIYDSNGNIIQENIYATDAISNHFFGCSVSVSGDGKTIAVGAYGDADKGVNAGAVYIF